MANPWISRLKNRFVNDAMRKLCGLSNKDPNGITRIKRQNALRLVCPLSLNIEFLIFDKSFVMPAAKTSSKKGPAKKPKSTSKKKSGASSSKSELGINYSDKSPGQPQLIPIFDELKKLLTPYHKGTMKLLGGTDGKV